MSDQANNQAELSLADCRLGRGQVLPLIATMKFQEFHINVYTHTCTLYCFRCMQLSFHDDENVQLRCHNGALLSLAYPCIHLAISPRMPAARHSPLSVSSFRLIYCPIGNAAIHIRNHNRISTSILCLFVCFICSMQSQSPQ